MFLQRCYYRDQCVQFRAKELRIAPKNIRLQCSVAVSNREREIEDDVTCIKMELGQKANN